MTKILKWVSAFGAAHAAVKGLEYAMPNSGLPGVGKAQWEYLNVSTAQPVIASVALTVGWLAVGGWYGKIF